MEELFSGNGWQLRREDAPLPNGKVKTLTRGKLCDTVHLLILPTPATVLILREFRPFWKDYVWMLPSGKVDKETDLKTAAERELREETGFRAEHLEPYFSCSHREAVDYTCHVFLACSLVRSPLPPDDTELFEVHELSFSDAINRVLKSPVLHSLSALTLLRYAREHHL